MLKFEYRDFELHYPGRKNGASVFIPHQAGAVVLKEGKTTRDVASGKHSLRALFKAWCRATGVEAQLTDLQVQAALKDGEIEAEASVQLSLEGQVQTGSGKGGEIGEALSLAIIDAMNKLT